MAGKVKKGEVLIADSPLEYTDYTQDRWLGFYVSEPGDGKPVRTLEDYCWVNVTQVEKQSDEDDPYIVYYPRSEFEPKLPVQVQQNGEEVTVTSVHPEAPVNIARAHGEDSEVVEELGGLLFEPAQKPGPDSSVW